MVWASKPKHPILVPRRSDGEGPRDLIWSNLRSRVWGFAAVYEGHDDSDQPFNRSLAINTAAKNAGGWDVAVIADADSFVPDIQLEAAISLAEETGRLVIPHSRWVNVEFDEVSSFLNTGHLLYDKKRTIYGSTVSSVLVVPRKVWETVNGFDQRFRGWGWEDVAFMEAVTVLAGGPVRLEGSVYHLAHDRPEADTNRQLDAGYISNTNRWRQYKLAKTPGEIRKLIAGNMLD